MLDRNPQHEDLLLATVHEPLHGNLPLEEGCSLVQEGGVIGVRFRSKRGTVCIRPVFVFFVRLFLAAVPRSMGGRYK